MHHAAAFSVEVEPNQSSTCKWPVVCIFRPNLIKPLFDYFLCALGTGKASQQTSLGLGPYAMHYEDSWPSICTMHVRLCF